MFRLKLVESLSLVRDVTYVISGCLVVQQLPVDRLRSNFGSPLFLYIASSLAVKCQELHTDVKYVKLNGVVMSIFLNAVFIRFIKEIHFVLTLSNPIFLPTAYSPALICFGRE
jgi:hypothetical protein